MGRRKIYVLLCTILLVLCMTTCNITSEKNAENSAEEEFIEYLLTEDSFKYSDSIMNEWNDPKLHKEIEQKCADKDGKSNFILGSLTLFEGDTENASLYFKKAVDEIDNDEIRLKARSLYELSKCYIYMEKYSEAEETISQMTHLFDKEENKDYLIVLNMWLSYDIMGMPDGVAKSLSLMKKTYEIAKETDYEEIERVLQMLAKFYMYNDEVVKSIDLYIEALNIAESKKNEEMIIRISSELAAGCGQIGNNEEAIKYYNKAYQEIVNQKSLTQDMLTFGIFSTDGLVNCYINENDLDKAWFYINESKDFINNQDPGKVKEDNLTKHYASLGNYYIAKGDISKALENLKLAEERFNADPYFNYANFDISLYTCFGDAYLAQKEYDAALEYYSKVENIYASVLNCAPEKECLEGFYNAYKGKGDYEKASYYAELMYNELNDSYISQEQQHATYMVEKYQNEKNEKEILNLQNRNRDLIYVVVIVCVIAAVFIIFIFSIHKRTKKIEQLNEKLKDISEHDSLTGLFNRRAMNDFLRENWDRFIENELPLSMIMMDVDYFKLYNDFYGHQMGDDVLAEIGKIIQSMSRENDFSVRYGGEEFLIIMSETPEDEALQVANKINQAVEKLHIKHEKSEVSDYVTMSMGIYTSNDNMSSREVLSKTDKILYEAKKTRNTIQQNSVL